MDHRSTQSSPLARIEASAVRGIRATIIGIIISTALAAIKILSGLFGNSYALVADGAESMLDIFSASIAWGGLRLSARPPDRKHPYGHGKAEAIASLIIASGLIVTALGIAVQSVREIRTPHQTPQAWTLIVLVVVVLVKELLFRFFLREGLGIHSRALVSDAWHHRSDALTSIAAFIGISIALWKGQGYESADDWAALFACGVIAVNGFRLASAALDDVMDAAGPVELEKSIRQIAATVPGVLGTHKCRARRSGLSWLVDLDIVVDGEMSVRDGHDVAHGVKAALLSSHLGILDVLVHVEPPEVLRASAM